METFLSVVAAVGFLLTYLALYKVGYYSGRLDEIKDTKKWLLNLLEEAEKREAIKNAVTKPAVEKK